MDLQPLFFELTLDSATEFLFGESVHSLSSIEGSEQDDFGRAFDIAQGRLANRIRLGKMVRIYRDGEFDAACKTVHQFVDKIVFKALERLQPRDAEKIIDGKREKERYVFLDEMVKSTRDPHRLRDELLNILLAGRDTTASLLSNTFHVLARRPDIWAKLKAEVDTLKGEKPNYETLRNMKYLKYLLNECTYPSSLLDVEDDILLTRSSSPPLPCRPIQRPLRACRHHPPTRRWTFRPLSHLHPARQSRSLQHTLHAPPHRYLRL